MAEYTWATPYALFLIGFLFWYAFNHPRSYGRVLRWALFATSATALSMFFYVLGRQIGANSAFAHVSQGGTKETYAFSLFGWWPLLTLPVVAVLMALEHVHKLSDEKPDNK